MKILCTFKNLFRICIFLFILSEAAAQQLDPNLKLSQYILTAWAPDNGPKTPEILDILQDKRGYMWFGSYDGLIRYNGNDFVIFNRSTNGQIKSNSARVLFQDKEGIIWIGTNDSGLIKYDGTDFTMLTEGLPSLSIRSITQDMEGTIWLGTAEGVALLKHAKGQASLLKEYPELSSNGVFFVYQDRKNVVWIGLNKKNGIFQSDLKKISPYKDDFKKDLLISCMIQDSAGSYWFGEADHPVVYRKHEGKITKYDFGSIYGMSGGIASFSEDRNHSIWISTDEGLIRFADGNFDLLDETNGLPNPQINKTYEDREGNFWIGLAKAGLAKLSSGKFITLTRTNGLINDTVNAVCEDSTGALWIGTDKGLSCYKKGEFIENRATISLKGDRIRHIFEDSNKNIWISSYSGKGLFKYDGRSLTAYTRDDGLAGNKVRFVFEDSSKNIWIGTTTGITRYSGGDFTTYRTEEGLSNAYCLCAFEDKDGNIWIGTDGGGINIIGKEGISTYTNADGLAGDIVFRFYEDSNGFIWITTSRGISLYRDKAFFNFRVEQGLLLDAVFQMLEDDQGVFWLTTTKGIFTASRRDFLEVADGRKEKLTISQLSVKDGLKKGVTPVSWGIKDKEGALWFPTFGGVSRIHPGRISRNTLIPPVYIESITVNNDFVTSQQSIVLKPGTKRVFFEYAALSYVVPEKVSYKYKLDGYDESWSDITNKREISYTNLPPGGYTFTVIAANNDGVWNKEGASITIKRQPFFYETLWFYIILLLLFILATYIIIKLRTQSLHVRQKELEIIVEERTKELKLEKEKSENLLLNILPLKVVEDLKQKGKSDPQLFDDVTVYFSDIVGFTNLSSTLDPKILILELNDIFTSFDEIMEKFGCERIKTIGDAYLSVCGMHEENSNHADNMINAAREIVKLLEERNKTSEITFEVRIGIHTGKLVGGIVGVKKYIYDIFGDTINTASRMESNSLPMKINISESTYSLVKENFNCTERGPVEVKGKGVMKMYFVDN